MGTSGYLAVASSHEGHHGEPRKPRSVTKLLVRPRKNLSASKRRLTTLGASIIIGLHAWAALAAGQQVPERRVRPGDVIQDSLRTIRVPANFPGSPSPQMRFTIDDATLQGHVIRVQLRSPFSALDLQGGYAVVILEVFGDNDGDGRSQRIGTARRSPDDTSLVEVVGMYPSRRGATVVISVVSPLPVPDPTFELRIADLGLPPTPAARPAHEALPSTGTGSNVFAQCASTNTGQPEAIPTPAIPPAPGVIKIADAVARLGSLLSQNVSKGEFETSAEFETRQATFLAQRQARIDALLAGSYTGQASPIVGTYDADRELFPVTLQANAISEETRIRVPRAEARAFKEGVAAGGVMATATFWLEEGGRTFMLGPATMRVGARTYRTEPGRMRVRVERTIRIPFLQNPLSVYAPAYPGERFSPIARRVSLRPIVLSPRVGASLVDSGYVTLWDPPTGQRVHRLDIASQDPNTWGNEYLALTRDGELLATRATYANIVKVWNTASGVEVGRFSGVDDMAFGCSGQVLALLYETAIANESVLQLFGTRPLSLIREMKLVGDYHRVAWTPVGTHLVTGGSNSAMLVDVATGGMSSTGIPTSIHAIALSPDRKLLAIASADQITIRDSLDSYRRIIATLPAPGRTWAVVFSPDSRILGSTAVDPTAAIFDPLTGTVLRNEGAFAIQLSSDGGYWIANTRGLSKIRLVNQPSP